MISSKRPLWVKTVSVRFRIGTPPSGKYGFRIDPPIRRPCPAATMMAEGISFLIERESGYKLPGPFLMSS
jgi:hypothetical protein